MCVLRVHDTCATCVHECMPTGSVCAGMCAYVYMLRVPRVYTGWVLLLPGCYLFARTWVYLLVSLMSHRMGIRVLLGALGYTMGLRVLLGALGYTWSHR